MPEYRTADPEVQALAKEIIRGHHKHLVEWQVKVIFRDEAATVGDKVILGKARKVSGLNAFLVDEEAPPFFVIELAEDQWKGLTEAQRAALIDHELMHCRVKFNDDGEPTLVIAPHDLEEFHAIVVRHGLWKQDLQTFHKAIQLSLPSIADPDTGEIHRAADPELEELKSRAPIEAGDPEQGRRRSRTVTLTKGDLEGLEAAAGVLVGTVSVEEDD